MTFLQTIYLSEDLFKESRAINKAMNMHPLKNDLDFFEILKFEFGLVVFSS